MLHLKLISNCYLYDFTSKCMVAKYQHCSMTEKTTLYFKYLNTDYEKSFLKVQMYINICMCIYVCTYFLICFSFFYLLLLTFFNEILSSIIKIVKMYFIFYKWNKPLIKRIIYGKNIVKIRVNFFSIMICKINSNFIKCS